MIFLHIDLQNLGEGFWCTFWFSVVGLFLGSYKLSDSISRVIDLYPIEIERESNWLVFHSLWSLCICLPWTFEVKGCGYSLMFPSSIYLLHIKWYFCSWFFLFYLNTNSSLNLSGRLFKRAMSFVGKDYLCHSLWDKYIEFEFSQQQWSLLALIYVQTLKFPTKKLHRYYDEYTSHLFSNIWM